MLIRLQNVMVLGILEVLKNFNLSTIQTAKKHKVKVGICGQGPSDFPDFSEFLIKNGIDTLSVTPDSVLKTLRVIKGIENSIKA